MRHLAIALGLVARVAVAQQAPAPAGTISGSVIDAETSAPIAGATVTLASAEDFGLLADSRRSSPSYAIARTVVTTSLGTYCFADLPRGVFRVRVQRVGYVSATIDVELGESAASAVSIGLVVAPVQLRPVEVQAAATAVRAPARDRALSDDARVRAARERQRQFLSADVRELTSRDMAESATIGGGDLFRALERLPGVTQFDDWSARLWVRGNRWDHNRVYYDDLPLFEPLQALGSGSGVSSDAVGGVFLHPGVRPASVGGEGATRIDLRSPTPTSRGAWRGSAELSQLGVSGAVEHARADGSAGFTASAHQALGDWLPRGAFANQLADTRSFEDTQLSARADVDLGRGRSIETSGLVTRDAHRDQATLDAGSQAWGNAVARATIRVPVGSFATSHTIGVTHFSTSAARMSVQLEPNGSTPSGAVTVDPLRSTVDYLTIGGRAERGGAPGRIAAGYDVIEQRASFAGPRASVYWGDETSQRTERASSLTYASLWVDDRVQGGEHVTVDGGLRLDVGGPASVSTVRPAPSLQTRMTLAPDTWITAGVSRAFQYVQSIDLPMVAQGRPAPSLWLASGGDVPAMTVDNAMTGVERWMTGSVLATANVYVRRTRGAVAPDPTPGTLSGRPLFVEADEVARGMEISVRKLAGRNTGMIAYTYARAVTTAGGLSFVSPADRTHAIDAVWAVRLGSVHLSSAYALTSGAPYTRIVLEPSARREAPDAQRLPAYSSLDVALDYTHDFSRVSLVAYAGMHNVLGRTNLTWYESSGACGELATPGTTCRGHDLFAAPVRYAPSMGLRLLF